MNEQPQRPKLEVQPVVAHTAEISMARPWGLVTGSGPTPEKALDNLRTKAEGHGQEIFKLLWEKRKDSEWRKGIEREEKRYNKRIELEGAFSVGSTRLVYGRIGDEDCWVAYGTLLTDSTGDGTNWLQLKTSDGQDGQASGLVRQGGGDGSDEK